MIAGVEVSAVLVVGTLCAFILLLAETVHRVFRVEPEWTRKLVHVLMGLTASAFPWLFRSARSVLLVCAVFGAILGWSLVRSGLPAVHRVDRCTGGALWFPLAIAVVFVAADGRSDLYAIPMVVLTLADPAAAIVGRTYGAHRFRVGRDSKSFEGSLVFLLVASGCLFVALRVTTSLGSAELIARALGIGALLAGIEAVAPAGSDNFLVPVGAFLLLRATAPDGAAVALALVVFLSVVAAVGVGACQRSHRERARV
jgi:phytol kinase